MLGAIWAQSLDGVIGDGTGMPWHLPEDLKHFKETTLGSPVVMGRRTWESLPFSPLPSRANIIISSREAGDWSKGAYVYRDLPDFDTDAWIIGGAKLYEATLDEVDVIERTLIDVPLSPHLPHSAVYAPRISEDFELTSETDWFTSERGRVTIEGAEDSPLRYRFQRFERKAQ
ncbi:dihydrofolate reductase [Corynebacterium sp. p3-SID1145]|uniref:dihydrofolate reductase n=1 Tax=unclassified Corynebacterium TaxID=2624378 RepID=UPI0021AA5A20|nr:MULTISPECIES: dihydrofolate reductase [unclassified Corynebacterium]MCT1452591.1 dihydrofolate reductase [Corynebacterium sp. p3-SID1145]MCT1461493.1 dihydrofolate reductase [Corynebacterium sp. p3-SID1140]